MEWLIGRVGTFFVPTRFDFYSDGCFAWFCRLSFTIFVYLTIAGLAPLASYFFYE